ncbi:MAG: hypothetical protein ABNO60_00910 [Candidatus Shikimatogenerans sp. Tcar]|uniref:Uncharacterized protein n=1 Tax=Candidatus Shikimatogenerans sp. Tcar TaxID=3158565 RepID=A0AAU7QUE7_9FLAO
MNIKKKITNIKKNINNIKKKKITNIKKNINNIKKNKITNIKKNINNIKKNKITNIKKNINNIKKKNINNKNIYINETNRNKEDLIYYKSLSNKFYKKKPFTLNKKYFLSKYLNKKYSFKLKNINNKLIITIIEKKKIYINKYKYFNKKNKFFLYKEDIINFQYYLEEIIKCFYNKKAKIAKNIYKKKKK